MKKMRRNQKENIVFISKPNIVKKKKKKKKKKKTSPIKSKIAKILDQSHKIKTTNTTFLKTKKITVVKASK